MISRAYVIFATLLILLIPFSSICGEFTSGDILDLEWGKGSNKIGYDKKAAFPGEPQEFCVDETQKIIYILDYVDGFKLKAFKYWDKGKTLKRRNTIRDGRVRAFNIDKVGNLYLAIKNKANKIEIHKYNTDFKLIQKVSIDRNLMEFDDIQIDEKGFVFIGKYGLSAYKFNSEGRFVSEYNNFKYGFVRSKGKYYLNKNISRKSTPLGKKEHKTMGLFDFEGKVISALPDSAALLGVDANKNCYIYTYDSESRQKFIQVLNASGINEKHLFNIDLFYDPDNYRQIIIGDSGKIYVIPNNKNRMKFKMLVLQTKP